MGNKKQRTDIIRRIISEELIGSQEELMKRLDSHGVSVTQSTLSRDFKSLNISKTPHPEKGYVYVLNDDMASEKPVATSNLGDAILHMRFSGNIGVITTKSGYASAVSVVVDGIKARDILGTVAGDNTIVIILREGAERKSVAETLRREFPALKYSE